MGDGFGLHELGAEVGAAGEAFAVDGVVAAKDVEVFGALPDAVEELGVGPEHVEFFFEGAFALLFHEEPGVVEDAAADHGTIELMVGAFFAGFLDGFDVAVADDGDVGGDLIAETGGFGDFVPVGGADGHLFLGAAVEGEGGGLGFE